MGFNWNDLLNEVGGAVGGVINPLDDLKEITHDLSRLGGQIVQTGGNLGGKLIDTGGKLIDKGLGSLDGLVNMIPYILVGGVVLLVMTKGGKSF